MESVDSAFSLPSPVASWAHWITPQPGLYIWLLRGASDYKTAGSEHIVSAETSSLAWHYVWLYVLTYSIILFLMWRHIIKYIQYITCLLHENSQHSAAWKKCLQRQRIRIWSDSDLGGSEYLFQIQINNKPWTRKKFSSSIKFCQWKYCIYKICITGLTMNRPYAILHVLYLLASLTVTLKIIQSDHAWTYTVYFA